ncbi:MAG: cation:proton antiporter [Treponema sp.]|nr:cation:proton antiporter [Treponema sp.]
MIPSIPVTDPVGVFFIVLVALFAAPILAELVRLPGLVGTALAGMLLGPRGLGILESGSLMEAAGGFGLVYIFFAAGLELDLRKLRRKSPDAVVFGGLTFLIPLGLGYAAGTLVFGLPVVPAILFASLFASHTMLPYPIVQTMGLSGSRAVFASVGATTITDVLAMLALALTTAGSGTDWFFWLRTLGVLAAWTVGAALLLPPVIRRFFRRIKTGGPSEFLFALVVVLFCSAAAGLAGIQPAVGAFAAGILLNRHIPERSGLMYMLRFAGDALFIPLCVFYIGMLVDATGLVTIPGTAMLAAVMLGVVLVSKYASSLILKPLFGFSLGEVNISFGLSVNQTASTLAAALVGYRLGLLGETVLGGTVVMFIVTCALGPFVTRRAAGALAVESARGIEGRSPADERILIAVSNPGTLRPLADFAFLMRDPKSPEPVLPVCVVQDSPDADRDLEQAETILAQAIAQGANHQGLQDDHAQQDRVAGAHGLQGAEVAKVLEGEIVEGLTGDGGPDEKAQHDGDPEIDGDTGALHIIVEGQIFEILSRVGCQPRALADPISETLRLDLVGSLDENKREQLALLRGEGGSPAVGGVDHGLRLKGP